MHGMQSKFRMRSSNRCGGTRTACFMTLLSGPANRFLVFPLGRWLPYGLALPRRNRRSAWERAASGIESIFTAPSCFRSCPRAARGDSEEPLPDDFGCNWRACIWIPINYYVFMCCADTAICGLPQRLPSRAAKSFRTWEIGNITSRRPSRAAAVIPSGAGPCWRISCCWRTRWR